MAKLFEPPRFLAIEGPIRVGKSTLARILAEHLHARHITEPENNPFLDGFYAGEKHTAFETQMWFLMERYEQMSAEREQAQNTVPVIADYLFEKDKIFACLNLSDEELNLYNRYYNRFRKEIPTPDLVIYLHASPDVLKQRLKRKGVPGERAISEPIR
jgi:deoxyadenosine/deoxycytidine kinase